LEEGSGAAGSKFFGGTGRGRKDCDLEKRLLTGKNIQFIGESAKKVTAWQGKEGHQEQEGKRA